MKGLGMEARSTVVRLVRAVFNFAYNQGLIDRPLRFGRRSRPRAPRTAKGQDRQESRAALDGRANPGPDRLANVHFRAMILLGVNCGLGNNDCGNPHLLGARPGRRLAQPPPPPQTGCPAASQVVAGTVEALRRRLPNVASRRDAVDAGPGLHHQVRRTLWVRWKKKEVPDRQKSLRDAVTIAASRLLFRKIGSIGVRASTPCGG